MRHSHIQGSYPFLETNFQDFSRIVPGLRFFKGSKIHFDPYTPKILMSILLTAFHTLYIFLVEFNRFPELSRTSGLFLGLSRFSRTRANPAYNKRDRIFLLGNRFSPLTFVVSSSSRAFPFLFPVNC